MLSVLLHLTSPTDHWQVSSLSQLTWSLHSEHVVHPPSEERDYVDTVSIFLMASISSSCIISHYCLQRFICIVGQKWRQALDKFIPN